MGTSAYTYRVVTTQGLTPEAIESELNMAGGAGFNVRDIIQGDALRGALILLEKYTTLDEIIDGKKED